FENTPVWQSAARLYVCVDDLVSDEAFRGPGDLRDQLLRASLSISNNIAEGFERGTTTELITFLYYARGSAGEARSMLTVIRETPRFCHLKSQISDLQSLAESIARQLGAWAHQLQNSDIEGQRLLTDAARARYVQRDRARALEAKLAAIVEESREQREKGRAQQQSGAHG
ncbi:MAG: four helix bundle protein, partial [Phycisphaerales bacterium JB039]